MISTLRPGLIVALKTSVMGNAKYYKETLVEDHLTKDGSKEAEWKTKRTIEDPEEHEAAKQVRSKVCSMIRAVCSDTAFGIICPESRKDELNTVIAEAKKLADDFNQESSLTRVGVYILLGRVAQDDVEAVRAINTEVKELMLVMENGLANLDAEAVRDAARRLKGMGQLLSENASAKVENAISVAREVATKITKAGETAAMEVDLAAIKEIAECRTSFLDMDLEGEIEAPESEGLDLDLDDDEISVDAPVMNDHPTVQIED